MQETQVQSLGQEDPLEEGVTTHSGILPWRIPWTEEPGGLQSMRAQRVRHKCVTEHIQLLNDQSPNSNTSMPGCKSVLKVACEDRRSKMNRVMVSDPGRPLRQR